METHVLIGKTIKEVQVADDQGAIRFVLDDGNEIVARADGDCCSHSWIEDVINHEAIIGSPVLLAQDIDMPESYNPGATKHGHYEEEMAFYGFEIKTAKGTCTIEYRNSSNGYYGGDLKWTDDHFYGGVYGQNCSKENWKPVNAE
jgi:hypothetical protein